TAGQVAIVAAGGDVEKIIPMYIKSAMPGWFGMLFMLALLAAAMSTLSSQFHVMGTSLGRDLYEQALTLGRRTGGVVATRMAILIGIIVSVYLGYVLEQKFGAAGVEIVARGTAVFFGMCACAFLPMFVGGLWSRGITRAGAVAGMLTGAISSIFWMLFVHEKLASAFGLSERLFGVRSLGVRVVDGAESLIVSGPVIWAYVDPLIIGLPVAVLATVLCSCCSRKFSEGHLALCFGTVKSG
ncbi:MAG: sodium:solute symporter family protein, partial [Lentisphaerae bacterium]|nr:sodium:solute symporter family protein [Lentisphaerota bacterium]